MRKNELVCSRSPVFDVYALSVCALLTALSVVLARLLTVIPSEVSRFSLEAVPIICRVCCSEQFPARWWALPPT